MHVGQLFDRTITAVSQAAYNSYSRSSCRPNRAVPSRSSFKLQASSFWECSRTFHAIALHGSRHVYSSQRAGVSCAASKAPKKTTKPKKAAVKKEPEEAKDVEAEKVEAETVDEETAQKGDYVEVHYTCQLKNGAEFDTSRDREPFLYQVGSGTVVEGFDNVVMGMAVGEKRSRTLSPEETYGEYDEEGMVTIPTAEGPEDAEVGMKFMVEDEEGYGLPAIITDLNDEEMVLDFNHELASQTLDVEIEMLSLRKAANLSKATFGAGRFWAIQLRFERVPGVLESVAGYSQGESTEATSYDEVTSGTTGHAEVVQVTYDPKEVSYQDLLNIFFESHDPTQLNRQGEDIGNHYRSGIYVHDEQQAAIANETIAKLNDRLGGTVVTEVQPLANYQVAEDEHQHFLACGGQYGKMQSAEKGCTDPIRAIG